MKRPIYQKNHFYFLLKTYVDYCARSVYSKFIVRGMENIPDDGAVILAPNHTNALMDALVVLRSFEDATVFGARADVFRKPSMARLMHFFKILPMVRVRDGLHNVLKNYETMDEIVDALNHDTRFCMFPEGTHRMMHSLLPIRKGIFRIALKACETLGDRKPVYVVPLGIEYGNYIKYKSTCVMTFGQAINVSEVAKRKDLDDNAKYGILTEELTLRISSLITCIKDDEDYCAKWNLARIAAAGIEDSEKRLEIKRRAIGCFETLAAEEPETARELLKEVSEFEEARNRAGISYKSLGYGKNLRLRTTIKVINSVLAFPIFLLFAFISLPMWLFAEHTCKNKLEDKAFCNTVRFGVKAFLSPIMMVIWAVWYLHVLPLPIAILLFLLSLMSYSKFYEYCKYFKIMRSDYKLLKNTELAKKFNRIRTKFKID